MKTDVWIFGDVDGYHSLQSMIAEATVATGAVRPPAQEQKSNSMRLCILPAASSPNGQPRLKLVERIVCLGRAPEMELIIYGNRAGYRWLSECLVRAATEYRDDPSEHVHLDDFQDRRIVRRSVSLNIRGALSNWSHQALQHYASLVFDRQPSYLPSDIDYLSQSTFPYEEPVAGEAPFVLR